MRIRNFLREYRLSYERFAIMAHTSSRSLRKYDTDQPIQNSTKDRIDFALRVLEKYNYICPKYIPERNGNLFACSIKRLPEIEKYIKRFHELLEYEKSLET